MRGKFDHSVRFFRLSDKFLQVHCDNDCRFAAMKNCALRRPKTLLCWFYALLLRELLRIHALNHRQPLLPDAVYQTDRAQHFCRVIDQIEESYNAEKT